MDLRELFCFLALQRIFFTRPGIARKLFVAAGSVSAVFENPRERFRQIFGNEESPWKLYKNFGDWKGVEADFARLEKLKIRAICISDDDYPKLLKEIYDPPLLIFAGGEGSGLFLAPTVAIVGSRKATMEGKRIAFEIASCLSVHGICVASGLAYGIDAAAHRGCLEGITGTIAVLGSGPDVGYPWGHRDLREKIKETGLVISEFPLGTAPLPQNFPQRNRIISGLALGVVVIEAAQRSGSLITARLALEQNREVMAAPGAAGSVNFRGTNRLIRDGAHLIENGEDVLEVIKNHIPLFTNTKMTGHFSADMKKHSPLLEALAKNKWKTVDELVLESGAGASDVLMSLTELRLNGVVEEVPGRKFRLKGE